MRAEMEKWYRCAALLLACACGTGLSSDPNTAPSFAPPTSNRPPLPPAAPDACRAWVECPGYSVTVLRKGPLASIDTRWENGALTVAAAWNEQGESGVTLFRADQEQVQHLVVEAGTFGDDLRLLPGGYKNLMRDDAGPRPTVHVDGVEHVLPTARFLNRLAAAQRDDELVAITFDDTAHEYHWHHFAGQWTSARLDTHEVDLRWSTRVDMARVDDRIFAVYTKQRERDIVDVLARRWNGGWDAPTRLGNARAYYNIAVAERHPGVFIATVDGDGRLALTEVDDDTIAGPHLVTTAVKRSNQSVDIAARHSHTPWLALVAERSGPDLVEIWKRQDGIWRRQVIAEVTDGGDHHVSFSHADDGTPHVVYWDSETQELVHTYPIAE